jgi:pimeloyl-ACP methyl ester carboxylesterase
VDLLPLPDLRFSEIPAASRSRYKGDRFSYMEAGPNSAPALLLLHGIGANSTHWRFQFDGFADRFRVIAWNAPGYMLSDNLVAETPVCRDYADALSDFLDTLGIGRFDLLANSFGTRVAQGFAYWHPNRITRAVFTGTSISRALSSKERASIIEARMQQVACGGYGFGARAAALLGSCASADTAAMVQNTLRATNPKGFMQAVRCIAGGDVPRLGAGLTMPLLMIQGEEDRITPAGANAVLLAQAVPHARLTMLAGCGHLPEAEMPVQVNDLVREFLAGGYPEHDSLKGAC